MSSSLPVFPMNHLQSDQVFLCSFPIYSAPSYLKGSFVLTLCLFCFVLISSIIFVCLLYLPLFVSPIVVITALLDVTLQFGLPQVQPFTVENRLQQLLPDQPCPGFICLAWLLVFEVSERLGLGK